MIRPWLRALGASVSLTLVALAAPAGAAPPSSPSKGDVIPAFESLGIDGKAHRFDWNRCSGFDGGRLHARYKMLAVRSGFGQHSLGPQVPTPTPR